MSVEIEDGMGFSGLVPTAQERKQDEYEKELWNKIREKERRVMELETHLSISKRDFNERGGIIAELEADNGRLREALESIVEDQDGAAFTAQQALKGG